MEIVQTLLKTAHFFGLFMGGGSAFGMAVLGLTLPHVPEEHRATLVAMSKKFKIVSHAALALLIVTGALLALIVGAFSAASVWFWIKLVAVALLIIGIVRAGKAAAMSFNGDSEAAARAEVFGKMNFAALVVILFAAVSAFG